MLFGLMLVASALITYACLQNPEKFLAGVFALGAFFLASAFSITTQEPAGAFPLVYQARSLGLLVGAILLGVVCGFGLYKLSPNALRYETNEEPPNKGADT